MISCPVNRSSGGGSIMAASGLSRCAQLICRIRSEVEFGIYNQSDRETDLPRHERKNSGKKKETKEMEFGTLFKCILVYRRV